jgi:hypothetical protein
MEHADDDTHFAMSMGEVALKLFGEPTSKHHGGLEWRYGTCGSLSIDLRKGTFYDHEAGQGGGVLDLIVREIGGEHREALKWLNDKGIIVTHGSNVQAKGPSHTRRNYDQTEAKFNGNGSVRRHIVSTYITSMRAASSSSRSCATTRRVSASAGPTDMAG